MYNYHCNYIFKKHNKQAIILFIYTYSFTYHIPTKNVYGHTKLHSTHFDFSDYSTTYPPYFVLNKKYLGNSKLRINSFTVYRIKVKNVLTYLITIVHNDVFHEFMQITFSPKHIFEKVINQYLNLLLIVFRPLLFRYKFGFLYHNQNSINQLHIL